MLHVVDSHSRLILCISYSFSTTATVLSVLCSRALVLMLSIESNIILLRRYIPLPLLLNGCIFSQRQAIGMPVFLCDLKSERVDEWHLYTATVLGAVVIYWICVNMKHYSNNSVYNAGCT
jgi:hypothetical protein